MEHCERFAHKSTRSHLKNTMWARLCELRERENAGRKRAQVYQLRYSEHVFSRRRRDLVAQRAAAQGIFEMASRPSHRCQRSPVATLVFVSLCVVGITACTTQPPIVADPPQHTHSPPEIAPWEEQYGRARPKPEAFEESHGGKDSQPFNGDLEQTSTDKDSGGPLQVVVDAIAFPFRGVGWLLQEIF